MSTKQMLKCFYEKNNEKMSHSEIYIVNLHV